MPTASGTTKMTITKKTKLFVENLVIHYASITEPGGRYEIYLTDINEHDLHHLSGLLMADKLEMASEATGPDNEAYVISMLPTLITFMKNSDNADHTLDFVEAWKKGITAYFTNTIQEILDDEVQNFNDVRGLTR